MKKKFFIVTTIVLTMLIFPFLSATDNKKIIIYAPATPSSVPYIIAGQNLKNTEVTIFTNHSQANALFLRDDIQILTTGLSVGINFFKKDIPVQIINSYVSGLTYLVTYGEKISGFNEMKGKEIYVPFEGSPIEEVTRFFVKSEGLEWGKDIKPKYAPFQSSIELLKKGSIFAVALPEPFISQLQVSIQTGELKNIYISFSYKDKWDSITGTTKGYPQVGTFVKSYWAENNKEYIIKLNKEIEKAVHLIETDPAKAAQIAAPYFKFPQKILESALKNTDFDIAFSQDLKQQIKNYYEKIGKPLDESFEKFFYIY